MPFNVEWKCWKCASNLSWQIKYRCGLCLDTTHNLVLENGNRRFCKRCHNLTFLRTIPSPKWSSIAYIYRGKDEHFEVRSSTVGNGNAGLGVFATHNIIAGTTLIFGGDVIYDFCDDDESPYDLLWDQYSPGGIRGIPAYKVDGKGALVKQSRGWLAPLVNEPDVKGQKANCCLGSNYGGIYLIVCRNLDVGTELLVHYGVGYHDDLKPDYPPPPLSQDLTIKEKNAILEMLRLPLVVLP